MNRKRRTRYFLAVYLLVASFAIILVLIAIHYSLDPLQTLLLNLSTELLGVAMVFFLVNRLFLVEEWDLSERIGELANRLEQHTTLLRGPEGGEREVVGQLLTECSQISLLGYSFIGFLKTFRDPLTKRVRDGAKLRVMVVDPESKAAELILENSKTSEFRRDIETSLDYARLIAEQSQDGGKGHIEVRLLNWIPSCSLIIIDADRPEGYVRVGIYPPCYRSPLNERAHFILARRGDERWYNGFADQYERLWSQAQTYDLNAVSL